MMKDKRREVSRVPAAYAASAMQVHKTRFGPAAPLDHGTSGTF